MKFSIGCRILIKAEFVPTTSENENEMKFMKWGVRKFEH